jgi:hypothetical protein
MYCPTFKNQKKNLKEDQNLNPVQRLNFFCAEYIRNKRKLGGLL